MKFSIRNFNFNHPGAELIDLFNIRLVFFGSEDYKKIGLELTLLNHLLAIGFYWSEKDAEKPARQKH